MLLNYMAVGVRTKDPLEELAILSAEQSVEVYVRSEHFISISHLSEALYRFIKILKRFPPRERDRLEDPNLKVNFDVYPKGYFVKYFGKHPDPNYSQFFPVEVFKKR